MKDTILSVAGRSGLFRLLAQGHGSLIVENIIDKRRSAVGTRERVTSLNDVSMFTDEDDVSLMSVFDNIQKACGAETGLDHKQASDAELRTFMEKALPNYDRDRVRVSDMRKLLQWYNILAQAGYSDFSVESDQ